jgi:hypothetical protein
MRGDGSSVLHFAVMTIVTGLVGAGWISGTIIAGFPFVVTLVGIILIYGGIPTIFLAGNRRSK